MLEANSEYANIASPCIRSQYPRVDPTCCLPPHHAKRIQREAHRLLRFMHRSNRQIHLPLMPLMHSARTHGGECASSSASSILKIQDLYRRTHPHNEYLVLSSHRLSSLCLFVERKVCSFSSFYPSLARDSRLAESIHERGSDGHIALGESLEPRRVSQWRDDEV